MKPNINHINYKPSFIIDSFNEINASLNRNNVINILGAPNYDDIVQLYNLLKKKTK